MQGLKLLYEGDFFKWQITKNYGNHLISTLKSTTSFAQCFLSFTVKYTWNKKTDRIVACFFIIPNGKYLPRGSCVCATGIAWLFSVLKCLPGAGVLWLPAAGTDISLFSIIKFLKRSLRQ